MGAEIKARPNENLTRTDYAARIVSYVKDNPYFGYEEIDRGESEFVGKFSSDGVSYVFRITQKRNKKPLITIERKQEEKIHISEVAIQALYDKVRTSYEGYIINTYSINH